MSEENKIEDSNVENSNIEESRVKDSKIVDSTVENSKIEDSVVRDSKVEDSTIKDSKIVHEEVSHEHKEVIEFRKEEIVKLVRNKINWISYLILAFIVWISVFIRTRNIDRLKDITTNDWTLAPDLDPFVFLRWAQYIAENGKLFAIDTMRNVPLGFDTASESKLLPQMIVWTYDFLRILPDFLMTRLPGSPTEITVTYAAVIFPVIMFALTVIAIYVLARKVFYDSFENKIYPEIIALTSAFLLSVLPAILSRTIAGVPEKESASFLFIFLAFYFFISAFKSKDYKFIAIHSILAGLSTAALGLIWGGVTFVFMTIGLSVFVAFVLGTVDKKRFIGLTIFIATFAPILVITSLRFSVTSILTSTSTMPIFASWFFIALTLFAYPKIKNIKIISKYENKFGMPKEITVLIIGTVLAAILVAIVLGPGFFVYQVQDLSNNLIRPLGVTRFALTVAENRQPFWVGEWRGNFGPLINNVPLFFWLFILGSISLLYTMANKISKKDKIAFSIAYFIFLIFLIFSRYSPNSVFNGTSGPSILLYSAGVLIFIGYSALLFYKYHKAGKGDALKFDFGYLVILIFFFSAILGARGAVRFIMMIVPPASMIVGFLTAISIKNAFNKKDDLIKVAAIIFALIIVTSVLYSGFTFYNASKARAEGFFPSSYNNQWQNAMAWVRDNTSEDAVFGHWWDYGYWVQSIGERATVLDGGNAIVYWNHLMGRHVLTAPDDEEALTFLYTHDTTHYLIDSTELGKYSAYSSIGSDENNDRLSFIPTFFVDEAQTRETNNGTSFIYPGGIGLDGDLTYEENGTTIKIPRENSGILGIQLTVSSSGEFEQPIGLLVNQGQQQTIPLKYMYVDGELIEYDSGIEAGIFLVDQINPQPTGGIALREYGAAIYLSERTVHSFLARKYLFGEEENFKLVHTEPNLLTADLRRQGLALDDFAYFQGNLLGPIKIWEIEYPDDIEKNDDYLLRLYPDRTIELA